MKELRENEKQAADYLLGAMTGAERDQFEERLFLDEDLSFSVEAAEKDLIDEFLRGELSFDEKQKFERNFLITDSRREKLRAAGILNAGLFAQREISAPAKQSFWEKIRSFFALPNIALAAGAAAIILFLILGGIWLLRQENNPQIAGNGNSQKEVAGTKENPSPAPDPSPKENSSNSNSAINANNFSNENAASNKKASPNTNSRKQVKPENPPSQEKPESSAGSTLAFTLFPAIRSGENPQLVISPEVETVNLRVVHNNEDVFVKYRAELRNSNGDTVWSREVPVRGKSKLKSLNFAISGKLLKADSYELALLGITPAGEYEETNFYNFTVRKK